MERGGKIASISSTVERLAASFGTGKGLRAIEKDAAQRLRQLDRQVGETAVTGLFDSVIEQNVGHEEVGDFLEHLREFTLGNVEMFRERNGAPSAALALAATSEPAPLPLVRGNV